jgi:UDP-N-acetylmuramoyl-tripeptide--D-alanyl-D-alanine ligase
VVSDSRQVDRGALFVALEGERTDGHRYLEEVAQKGAAAVLVAAEHCASAEGAARLAALGTAVLCAERPLAGLQELAAWWVDRHSDCIRIGITGSNGKTTTKEIVASILRQEAATVWNTGNYNSDVGLSLSVFSITPEHRYGVFEMGMNRRGELGELSRILRPQYMLLTMLGTAHIGMLGSRRAIAEEKAVPFQHLPAAGAAFIPERCNWEELFVPPSGAPLYRFGAESIPGYAGAQELGLGGWRLSLDGAEAHFPLVGEHNLSNALAAIRLCRYLGVSREAVCRGLEAVQPVWGRSVVSRGAVTIVEDSYNANTESVTAMLRWLSAAHTVGRLVCVLGSMKELGEESEAAHRSVGRELAERPPAAVFLFGEETAPTLEELRKGGYEGRAEQHSEFTALRRAVTEYIRPGDTVLLKGSRSMELERLVEPIKAAAEEGAEQHGGSSPRAADGHVQ